MKPPQPLQHPFCSACNAALGAAGALVQEDKNKLQAKAIEDFAKNPKFMEILRKLVENPSILDKIT